MQPSEDTDVMKKRKSTSKIGYNSNERKSRSEKRNLDATPSTDPTVRRKKRTTKEKETTSVIVARKDLEKKTNKKNDKEEKNDTNDAQDPNEKSLKKADSEFAYIVTEPTEVKNQKMEDSIKDPSKKSSKKKVKDEGDEVVEKAPKEKINQNQKEGNED